MLPLNELKIDLHFDIVSGAISGKNWRIVADEPVEFEN